MNFLINLDKNLTFLLKNLIPENIFFNNFFSFFSLKGNSIIVWIILIIIILFFEEKKHPGISKKDKLFVKLFLIAFLSTAFIVEFPLKNFFHRFRPTATILNKHQPTYKQTKSVFNNFNCPKDYSFPSGHSATAFAAATVLTFFDKKRKWLYYFAAILIAYSRIYLGCHYFFDVFFGSLIGYFLSKILLKHLTP